MVERESAQTENRVFKWRLGEKIKWKKKRNEEKENCIGWERRIKCIWRKRRNKEGMKEKIAKNKTTNYLIDILCHITGCDSLELFYLILATQCKNSRFMLLHSLISLTSNHFSWKMTYRNYT